MQTTSNHTVNHSPQHKEDFAQLAGLIDRVLNNAESQTERNAELNSPDSNGRQFHDVADTLAARERELQSLLKQLRRVLPATYFRTNSRVYRVMEEINKTVAANDEAAFKLRDWSSQMDSEADNLKQVFASLRQLRSRLE